MIDSQYEVLVLCLVFTNYDAMFYGQTSPLCPKDNDPDVLRFVWVQRFNPKLCCYVLREEEVFSWQPFKTNYPCLVFFLIVLLWTLAFNIPTESCRVWDVQLGLFALYLSVPRTDFGLNLVGHLFLGRLTGVFNIFCLWIISHCRIIDFKLFGNGIITHSQQQLFC